MNPRLILLVVSLIACSCGSQKETADLIIRGGKIYTVDARYIVEAVAVKNGAIIFCGLEKDVQDYIGRETKVIDLKGRTMTPGFIEGHGHLMGLGFNELNLDLSTATSFEEIVVKVKDAASKVKPGHWIIGRGWHQDKWNSPRLKRVKGFPTHEAISAVSPDNPVYLTHASGHASLANAYAMKVAGVDANPPGDKRADGEIIRDERGLPTGIFNEQAQSLITKCIPQASMEYNTQALEHTLKTCNR